jgi:hypothetical protein
MSRREEIAWAGGLFEGEGCFTICTQRNTKLANGRSRTYRFPRARLVMTDEDAIRRFNDVVGFGRVLGPRQAHSGPTHKPVFEWQVYTFEHVQALYAMLYPWLCARRRARGAEVLAVAHSAKVG